GAVATRSRTGSRARPDEQLRDPTGELEPPDRWEPDSTEHAHHVGRRGQVGHRPGQVAVRGTIGERATDQRHDLLEVERMARAEHAVVRAARVEQRDGAARSYD